LRDSDSLQEVANAIRFAPPTAGGDTPEALEDALHYVLNDLSALSFENARIVVFTDAPPHAVSECPHRYDFEADLAQIVQTGASVELIDCSPDNRVFSTPALPGVKVVPFSSHSWT
jgi:hypothetical protein